MAIAEQDKVTVAEPFPISLISGKHFLFDVNIITYVRREHHIGGVLVGTLPQFPQQNVFLGVPVVLMPEEARLLVEKGAAYIVDEVKTHSERIPLLSTEEKEAFMETLEREGKEVARDVEAKANRKRELALAKLKQKRISAKPLDANGDSEVGLVEGRSNDGQADEDILPVTDDAPGSIGQSIANMDDGHKAHSITPTLSYPPLSLSSASKASNLPEVPKSYPLYAHLHSKGYFLSPGLRFGCQYLAYPGDPLRFHSHFLAISVGWDEQIDLMDIVGGGRLGTGVKKGFLVGGLAETGANETADSAGRDADGVRTFCIEWGGM